MPPPSATSKVVLRSLYRSLLRAAAPFSPPSPSAAAYASLIHRSGVAHDWEGCVHKLDNKRRAAASREKTNTEKNKGTENSIPKSWAQNLSRSYSDLKEEYALRREYFEQRYGVDEDDWDDDEVAMDLAMGTSSYYKQDEDYNKEEDPKFILFRHLLREWFAAGGGGDRIDNNNSGEKTAKQWPMQWSPNEEGYYENGRIKQVPLMKFPSQILSDGGLSIRELIQREFRAPTVEERLNMESQSNEEDSSKSSADENPKPKENYPPSSFIDSQIRMQTAFYTLMELNRKLAWAEKIGLPSSSYEATKQERKWKRLVQAAKGVKAFPTIEPKETVDGANVSDSDSEPDSKKTSSPLQSGTYLIAHPLMTGYFAKAVIVLLDHAEEQNNSGKTEEEENSISKTEEEESVGAKTEEEGGGGTYGLIINRLALQPEMVESSRRQMELLRLNWEEKKSQLEEEPAVGSGNTFEASNGQTGSLSLEESTADSAASPDTPRSTTIKSTSHNILRPISLLQAINADDLPDTVQMAFGDAPVREGGPVNLSLQMIHRKTLEMKGDQDITDVEEEESEKKEGLASQIGGTLLGSEQDNSTDSEDTIYFGGDVIKASYAVLGGDSEDDYSFVIGAACWAPGQLEHEIERGCWLPFQGPAQMSMTGMCEHNEIITPSSENDDDSGTKGTKLSLFPPRPNSPSNAPPASQTRPVSRPVGDLWLSIMCALGDGEADLAYMMLDSKNIMNELGDACDNLDR